MKRKCLGKRSDGSPCGNYPVRGATVCKNHGGLAPQVRSKAIVRAELSNWGLHTDDVTVDPGETLLRLVTQSARRAEEYAAAIKEQVDEHGLHEALVGDNLIFNPNTNSLTKVSEYVRGLAQLESEERDRCARFASTAIAAGLAERTVRLAERQTEIAEKALLAALEDLGLDDGQRQHAVTRLAHHLQLVG